MIYLVLRPKITQANTQMVNKKTQKLLQYLLQFINIIGNYLSFYHPTYLCHENCINRYNKTNKINLYSFS